ncbi:MAG: WecB/TagA/CpsF family glycosyltransferase [Lachnospiraceae bacterium]|nr:WecB/TagA/CpsF family glycosyltransferase [Lachnospiraceae bacterium]
MFFQSKSNQRRILFIIDILVLTVSYYFALILRYGGLSRIEAWQTQYYAILLFLFYLCYLLIFLLYPRNRRRLTKMDPFENLVLVGYNVVLMAVLLFVFFFITKMHDVSRIALGITFLLYLVLDYLARMLYRKFLSGIRVEEPRIRTLLVTSVRDVMIAVRHFRSSAASQNIEFTGIVLVDADDTDRDIEGIPVAGNAEDLEDISSSPEYDRVFLYMPRSDTTRARHFAQMFLDAGKDVDLNISYSGHDMTAHTIRNIGDYQAIHLSALTESCRILGVDFRVSDIDEAVMYVTSHIDRLRGKYICFSNSHTAVMSRENKEYRDVQNGAALVFADGMPVVRQQHRKGYPSAERVAGPDFMETMFRATMNGSVSHYFYGSTPENIRLLSEKLPESYPGMVIKGMYSPPFRAISEEEDEEDIRRINESGADIVWVGLGAPKQEKWMAAHEDRINAVMIGVGAGFDFYAGTVHRAPKWIQQIGFEWLYRLFQDPKRLIRRYVVNNAKYIWYVLIGRHEA